MGKLGSHLRTLGVPSIDLHKGHILLPVTHDYLIKAEKALASKDSVKK